MPDATDSDRGPAAFRGDAWDRPDGAVWFAELAANKIGRLDV